MMGLINLVNIFTKSCIFDKIHFEGNVKECTDHVCWRMAKRLTCTKVNQANMQLGLPPPPYGLGPPPYGLGLPPADDQIGFFYIHMVNPMAVEQGHAFKHIFQGPEYR